MAQTEVIRTYLELTSPEDLRAATVGDPRLSLRRESPCSVETYRQLYDLVGRDFHWRDRRTWSDEKLAAHLAQPAVSVWVLRYDDALAGYFELVRHPDGDVEIGYFGIVGAYFGRGFGKHLLTRAVEESWELGASRVWLHTCTLDGPAALPNYQARGFRPFRTEHYITEVS